MSDPNAPGLKVCRADRDDLDPFTLPPRIPENITLRFARPDVSIAVAPDAPPPDTGGSTDTTPNAFTFTDVTGATLSTLYTSNTITVSGINAAAAISISGGSYSKNGGAYTSSPGTVVNGDTVSVRATSSGANSTAVNATLTIGGVSDTFTVTTAAATTTAYPVFTSSASQTVAETSPFSFAITTDIPSTITLLTPGADTALFDLSGSTVGATAFDYDLPADANGDNVYEMGTYRATSIADNTKHTDQTITVTVTKVVQAPTAFTFTDITGATTSTVYTSNTITVAGLTGSEIISITGGTYSKNGGAYTSAAGTVVNGDTIAVRSTSSASNSTAVNVVLTIGSVSDTYTVTTTSGAGLLNGSESDGTNLLTGGVGMTSDWSGGSAALTNAATTAPDGTTTASSLIENSSNDYHIAFQSTSGITAGVSHTASAYAKYISRRYLQIITYGSDERAYAIYDLVSGTVTDSGFSGGGNDGTGVIISTNIQAAVNGFYKCSMVFTTKYDPSFLILGLSDVATYAAASGNNIGVVKYVGDGASGQYLWRPKLVVT